MYITIYFEDKLDIGPYVLTVIVINTRKTSKTSKKNKTSETDKTSEMMKKIRTSESTRH